MRKKPYRPECDAKVVLSRSSSAISTCQYPLFHFSMVKTVASPSKSMHSSMRGSCSAMCLAGREHSPTVKQKEEKQQQKQPLPMARATERSTLFSLYVGLRPTVAQLRRGVRKDAQPGRIMVVETCKDLSARRVRVGLVYGNVTAVRWVVRPMLDERLQHLV